MSRRTNTRVLEDAGNIIRDVNIIDVSASETLATAEHNATTPVTWVPAGQTASLYQFRVKSRTEDNGNITHQLETVLGRLSRVHPRSILASAERMNRIVHNTSSEQATMNTVIEFIFQQWQNEFPWLNWATIPTLRLQTSAGAVTPTVEAIAIRQEPGRERSARRILDQLLSPFTGHVLRVQGNQLVIIPPPTTTTLTLSNNQITSIDREVHLDDIVNRATVRSRQWANTPAKITSGATFGVSANIPSLISQISGTGNRTGFEDLGTDVHTSGQWGGSRLLHMEPEVLPAMMFFVDIRVDRFMRRWDGSAWQTQFPKNMQIGFYQELSLTEDVESGSSALQVAPLEHPIPEGARILMPNFTTSVVSATANAGATTINVGNVNGGFPRGTVIPHSRISMDARPPVNQFLGTNEFIVDIGTSGNTDEPWARLQLNWDGQNLRVRWTALRLQGPEYEDAIRAVITVHGWNWEQTRTEITGTYGVTGHTDSATNASQSQFGVIERSIDAGFVNISPETALAIAEHFVRANREPRERITVGMTPHLPVRPQHLNRRVMLPGGVPVIVEAWEHAEMFSNTTATVNSSFTGVIHAAGEPTDPGDPGDRHFSHDFDKSFAGGLDSPQDA